MSFPVCLWKPVFKLLEDLNTPRSLTVMLLIKHEEYSQLVNLATDPALYLDATSYFKDAQATDLLRKCASLPTGIDTKAAAVKNFWIAEMQCAKTNLRLSPFLYNGPFEDQKEVFIADFIDEVKTKIRKTLGSVPSDIAVRFGPGATFNDRGRFTTIPDKMSSRPTITAGARSLLPLWEETAWFRGLCVEHANLTDPDTIRGNRFTTVPKDATKDRGICVEPSLNIFFQLGVGDAIRRRLEKVGIRLKRKDDNDPLSSLQAELHREIARASSADELYSTIDLSNASDTISRNLVKILLPEDWYCLLETLRSPLTLIEGKSIRVEKFSSMGNGFTFELETLIFWAITSAIADRYDPGSFVSSFGDDIICSKKIAPALIPVLNFFGFSINRKKSFISGNFRESCGGDFFNGQPVRAYFIKEYPRDPQDWIKTANGLTRASSQFSTDIDDRAWFQRSWFSCLDNLPSAVRRARGPSVLGDLVIHDHRSRWSVRVRNSISYLVCYRPKFGSIRLTRWKPEIQLASALLGIPSRGVTPRKPRTTYKVGRVPYS